MQSEMLAAAAEHQQALAQQAAKHEKLVYQVSRPGAGATTGTQWSSRIAVATPQSVTSWLNNANVEQRRALKVKLV